METNITPGAVVTGTAETITDEQIRALLETTSRAAAFATVCEVALLVPASDGRAQAAWRAARARCAAAWNARQGGN